MFRQLSALFFWVLAARLVPVVQGQVRVIGATQPVAARAGDDVTLPCRCEPAVDLTPLTVEWRQVKLKTNYFETGVIVYAKRGGEMVDKKSLERAELFPDQLRAGNASLTLRHVTLFDNGKYTCAIPDLKTEESLRSAQVTLTVQPSDESVKNPGGQWEFPFSFTTAASVVILVAAGFFLWHVALGEPDRRVRPVMVEDVELDILNHAEPRPADGAQRTVMDAGDATMQ